MLVRTTFVVRDGEHFIPVAVEAEASWDFLKQEPALSTPCVMGWEGKGPAPLWESLERRQQGHAFNAIAEVLDYQALQEEAAGALPFVVEIRGAA